MSILGWSILYWDNTFWENQGKRWTDVHKGTEEN